MATSDSTTPLKRCTKCGNEYPATTEYFHKRSDAPCGVKSKCIACCKLDYDPGYRAAKGSRYYAEHRDEIKAKVRDRYYSEHDKARAQHRAYYQTHKPKYRKQALAYRAQHPEAASAHKAVANAVERGKLPRASTQACANCGQQAMHYHHWSYAKEHRLDVTPLCALCHGITHRKHL